MSRRSHIKRAKLLRTADGVVIVSSYATGINKAYAKVNWALSRWERKNVRRAQAVMGGYPR